VKNLTLSLVWSNSFSVRVDLHVDDEEYCIYSGQFTDDESSDVLVTGCFDEDLSVQTQSGTYGDHLFTITRNGTVKYVTAEAYHFEDELFIDEEEFLSPAALDNGKIRRSVTDYSDYEPFDLSSEEFDELPELDDYDIDESELPEYIEIPLSLYIDRAFDQLHGTKTKRILSRIIAHARRLMKHPSLRTKIHLIISSARVFYSNQHLRFSSVPIGKRDYDERLPKLLKAPFDVEGFPITHAYFTVSDSGDTLGLAKFGCSCYKKSRSRAIISWNEDIARTATTLAHELGHAVGMKHDFQSGRHRSKSKCAKLGEGGFILNYGNSPKRTIWSECSNEDFSTWFFQHQTQSSFCLKYPQSGCSSSQFQCHDGKCIPISQRCDGLRRECPGGEDEYDCPLPDYF